MKKQLSRMMVVGVALAILCALVTINCVGQWEAEAWDRIPPEMKTHIITRDFSGHRMLSVMCFSGTEEAFGLFKPGMGIAFRNTHIQDLVFLGDKILFVGVAPDGNQYWFPWSIAFTQGTSQFSVGSGDYYSIYGPFDGGLLRKGTVSSGFVRIPSRIDVALPFTVWIGEDSGIIKAFYGIEDDSGEDE